MVFLALGSNLGDRQANLAQARMLLGESLCVELHCSQVLETEAIGFDGEDFLNQVVAFESAADPYELLDICQAVEQQMGRSKHEARWDAQGRRIYENRIIDIDILTAGDAVMHTKRLTLPHPQCRQRPYVAALVATMEEEIIKQYKI